MDADAVATFLDAAFGGKPDDSWFLLWTLPDRASRWHQEVATAVTEARKLANNDVYVGVALSKRKRKRDERGKVDDAAGIVGLWADIDIADDEAHRKPNLPPDEDAARRVVKACGVEPTVLVHSGHGLQAWWLFTEPWWFDNDDERAQAQQLALQWNATLRMHAAESGWVIDSTHDLTRVLRLPGSINHKSEPVVARLLDVTPQRFAIDDFDPYLADQSALSYVTGRRSHYVMPGQLTLDAKVAMDHDRMTLLFDACGKKAQQTWDHARADLADQSPSSYDMAMARFAVQCGWSDQDVADLLIARRRKHGDDLKLRPDYYARTIGAARDSLSRESSIDELVEATERLNRSKLIRGVVDTDDPTQVLGPTTQEQHDRRQVHENLSKQLGIEIVVIERIMSEPIKYRIVTSVAAVLIENSGDLLDVRAMRKHIHQASNIVIPLMKQDQWDKVAQAMTDAAVEVQIGDETTNAGLCRTWLDSFLNDRPLEADFLIAAEARAPHRDDGGRVFIPSEALLQHVRISLGERVHWGRFAIVMRSFGCEPQSTEYVRPNGKGKRGKVSGWWLPDEYAAGL